MKNRDTQFAIRVDVGMEQRTNKLKLGGAHRIIFRDLEFSLEKGRKKENELDHAIPIKVPIPGTKKEWKVIP